MGCSSEVFLRVFSNWLLHLLLLLQTRWSSRGVKCWSTARRASLAPPPSAWPTWCGRSGWGWRPPSTSSSSGVTSSPPTLASWTSCSSSNQRFCPRRRSTPSRPSRPPPAPRSRPPSSPAILTLRSWSQRRLASLLPPACRRRCTISSRWAPLLHCLKAPHRLGSLVVLLEE